MGVSVMVKSQSFFKILASILLVAVLPIEAQRRIVVKDPNDPSKILIIERQRRSSTTYRITETWDDFDVQQYVESRNAENNLVVSRARSDSGNRQRTTTVEPVVSVWHEERIAERMTRAHFIAQGLMYALIIGGCVFLSVREFSQ